jgi:(p)ppGpp synthase/HD superfamily hydrolase
MVTLTTKFEEALVFSFRLHADQIRKVNDVPYVSHLLGVASLVLEHGGDEDEAIAALLHDAVEDQGGLKVLDEIRQTFGARVAWIVDGCTDSYSLPKPPWNQRKKAYLARLRDMAPEIRRVSLADKLHNARSLLMVLRVEKNFEWKMFNGGKEGTLWYFQALSEVFQATGNDAMTDEFCQVISSITELSQS